MFGKSYAAYYESLNGSKPYEEEIQFVYQWAKNPKSILDIGCGTAHYWKHYPKDVHIVGIDKSPAMIGRKKNIICADISNTKILFGRAKFDCVTALFDVLNYIPNHNWWGKLPLKQDGFFIFDVWDKTKAEQDGFKTTLKKIGKVSRIITPIRWNGSSVILRLEVFESGELVTQEMHTMFIYSREDIQRFCGSSFEIASIRHSETWQTFYKCRKK